MAITVGLHHRTSYRYDRAVHLSPHIVRLRPAPHTRTPIHSYRLTIEPSTRFINWQQDAFGNFLARLVFPEPTDHFSIDVELVAELVSINPFDFFLDEEAEHYPFDLRPLTRDELGPYLTAAEPLGRSSRVARRCRSQPRRPCLRDQPRAAPAAGAGLRGPDGDRCAEPGETLHRQAGSCRDSSWLLVEIAAPARPRRPLRLRLPRPAGADDPPLDGGPSDHRRTSPISTRGPRSTCPAPAGSASTRPRGLATAEGHIPLACTPDPAVGGADRPGRATGPRSPSASSTRSAASIEPPRVTKPYTDDEWSRHRRRGRGGRRRPRRRRRAPHDGRRTHLRLRRRHGRRGMDHRCGRPGQACAGDRADRPSVGTVRRRAALLHCGHGKWYPGEPLPRWQYTLSGDRRAADVARSKPAQWSRRVTAGTIPSRPAGSPRRWSRGWARLPTRSIDAFEDPVHLLWREALAAGGHRPVGPRPRRPRGAR